MAVFIFMLQYKARNVLHISALELSMTSRTIVLLGVDLLDFGWPKSTFFHLAGKHSYLRNLEIVHLEFQVLRESGNLLANRVRASDTLEAAGTFIPSNAWRSLAKFLQLQNDMIFFSVV